MPKYTVTVFRSERIFFEIDAENEEDAADRCLSDGDEVFSRTLDCSVTDVTLSKEY